MHPADDLGAAELRTYRLANQGPAAVATQDLTVLLKKNEFRYRMETVELEIGNPNDSAVEQIQVSILNGNVECEPARIPLLNGKKNTVIQLKARFKKAHLKAAMKLLERECHPLWDENSVMDIFRG